MIGRIPGEEIATFVIDPVIGKLWTNFVNCQDDAKPTR
jgi:hypothetical protein